VRGISVQHTLSHWDWPFMGTNHRAAAFDGAIFVHVNLPVNGSGRKIGRMAASSRGSPRGALLGRAPRYIPSVSPARATTKPSRTGVPTRRDV
jgi:hypothetical protein